MPSWHSSAMNQRPQPPHLCHIRVLHTPARTASAVSRSQNTALKCSVAQLSPNLIRPSVKLMSVLLRIVRNGSGQPVFVAIRVIWQFWWCESRGQGCVTLWVRLHSASKSAWVYHDKYVEKQVCSNKDIRSPHLLPSLQR